MLPTEHVHYRTGTVPSILNQIEMDTFKMTLGGGGGCYGHWD